MVCPAPGFALVTCLLVSGVVSGMAGARELDTASAFARGLAAYDRGDFEAARRHWEPLAEQGVTAAQTNLGVLYSEGHGVPRDDGRAVFWFERAARRGHAPAQDNLGVMYLMGRGVERNLDRALYWIRRAARQGYAPAQRHLGRMYQQGVGIDADPVKAAHWLELAGPRPDEFPRQEPLTEHDPARSADPGGAVPSAGQPGARSVRRVQLAAFRSREQAEKARARALEAHADLLTEPGLRIVRAEVEPGRIFFRLITGDIAGERRAEALCDALQERGADCLIR